MRVSKKNPILAYKAFDKDLQCRGFQYEVGKSYKIKGGVEMCYNGFHACSSFSDLLVYASIKPENRFAKVALWGDVLGKRGDKYCASNIKILEEIPYSEVIKMNNAGRGNTGLFNFGDFNSGNYNIGDYNTGSRNIGSCNTGWYNIGGCNKGYWNVGASNLGSGNVGCFNSGFYNIGNYNVGSYNIGNGNTGCFNTKSWPDYRWFDEPVKQVKITSIPNWRDLVTKAPLFHNEEVFIELRHNVPGIRQRLIPYPVTEYSSWKTLPNFEQAKFDYILDKLTKCYKKAHTTAETKVLKLIGALK